jgi:CRP/FNR family transcriptional regulator, nitrogen oxide reductase regulator
MTTRPLLSRRSLAALELFRGLSEEALDDALGVTDCRVLACESRIFNQGDTPVRAHALIDGSVRIAQSGSDGGQIVIRYIAPGEMFGTMALFTDRHYPADADTLTDTIEASWSEADLLGLMGRHPGLAINALKIAGRRLREAQVRLRELSTQSVERRVASALLRLAEQTGRSTPDGLVIGIPLRRKDIADICGTTLYSVSRTLTGWERQGLVVTRDQHLTITSTPEIRRIAQDEDA